MKEKIKIVASRENVKKIQKMFSIERTKLCHLECHCQNMDFLKIKYYLTIIYPDEILPECIDCIRKAKTNSKVLFLSDALNINHMIDFICAGAEDCFSKETYYLVERAIKDISLNYN